MAFVGSANLANSAAATTVVLTGFGFSIQAGDVLFLAFGVGNTSSSPTYPAGFTTISGLTQLGPQSANGGTTWTCRSKIAVGGETSFTITNGSSGILSGELRVYRGRSATPFAVTPVTTAIVAIHASPMPFSLTGITANAGDDIVAVVVMGSLGNSNAWNMTTPPSGYGNVDNFTGPVIDQPVLCACDQLNSAGGATGALTGSITSSGGYNMGYGGWTFSLAAVPFTPIQKTNTTSAAGGQTVTTTLNGVTAGSFLTLQVSAWCSASGSNPIGLLTPTDSNGTWQLATNFTGNNSTNSGSCIAASAYCKAAASGTHTLTISCGVGGSTFSLTDIRVTFAEWPGANFGSGTSVDVTAVKSDTTTQANTAGPTSPTSSAVELVLANVCVVGGDAAIAITDPPGGFTSLFVQNATSGNLAGSEHCYKLTSTTGTQSAAWTWTGANTALSEGVIAAFSGSAPSNSIQILYRPRAMFVDESLILT